MPDPTPDPTPPPPARVPELHFTSPAHTISESHAASIVITGTAADPDGISTVTWSNSANSTNPMPANGSTNWHATVPLEIGDNTIIVRAHTPAGAVAWADVLVVRRPDPSE